MKIANDTPEGQRAHRFNRSISNSVAIMDSFKVRRQEYLDKISLKVFFFYKKIRLTVIN